MEEQLTMIREQQKDSWNKFSPGWKKWDELTMSFFKPMGDEIIQLLQLKESDHVLDVAAGTGEPGLTIAGIVKKGKVTGTDLSEGMLIVANENAKLRGIDNYQTQLCDVSELPFDDNTFDAISCRFGYMFFPDMLMATKEMYRVLKPGGRIATSVWNTPDKNFWVTATMSTINNNMKLDPPPTGAPGMFRCAASGLVADLFKKVGLKNVSETVVNGKLNSGTAEKYWDMMNEVAAPIVSALSKADAATKEKIKKEVFEVVNERFKGGTVAFDSSALVIFGEK